MSKKMKIKIEDKIIDREDFFKLLEEGHKELAKLPFEEKIKHLIALQKLADKWGRHRKEIVWKI